MKDLNARLENIKGYYLEGEMEIINNEDVYKYDVKVAYQKNELFKVNLKNKANNHEQILLRNNDGVYVLTPSLNKVLNSKVSGLIIILNVIYYKHF